MPNKGYKPTEVHKAKLCAALIGNTNNLGHKHTLKTKRKMRAIKLGKKGYERTTEIRAKASAAALAKDSITEEIRNKISLAQTGENNNNYGKRGEECSWWKGGVKATAARQSAKRKEFGFIPLNDRFVGGEGHHIDKEFVVYIPKETHRSIYHSVTRDINMEEINALALDYVYGD